jgi:hypothetical protein
MAFSCCKSNSHSILESKHVEWMKNLPTDLHNEPITKLAIPGKKQSLIEMKIPEKFGLCAMLQFLMIGLRRT